MSRPSWVPAVTMGCFRPLQVNWQRRGEWLRVKYEGHDEQEEKVAYWENHQPRMQEAVDKLALLLATPRTDLLLSARLDSAAKTIAPLAKAGVAHCTVLQQFLDFIFCLLDDLDELLWDLSDGPAGKHHATTEEQRGLARLMDWYAEIIIVTRDLKESAYNENGIGNITHDDLGDIYEAQKLVVARVLRPIPEPILLSSLPEAILRFCSDIPNYLGPDVDIKADIDDFIRLQPNFIAATYALGVLNFAWSLESKRRMLNRMIVKVAGPADKTRSDLSSQFQAACQGFDGSARPTLRSLWTRLHLEIGAHPSLPVIAFQAQTCKLFPSPWSKEGISLRGTKTWGAWPQADCKEVAVFIDEVGINLIPSDDSFETFYAARIKHGVDTLVRIGPSDHGRTPIQVTCRGVVWQITTSLSTEQSKTWFEGRPRAAELFCFIVSTTPCLTEDQTYEMRPVIEMRAQPWSEYAARNLTTEAERAADQQRDLPTLHQGKTAWVWRSKANEKKRKDPPA